MATLLNRRRYMGGGGSLPYDAEVEYLQGDGTAYIDLGLKATGNMAVEMDTFDFFVESNKTKWPFGVKDNGVSNSTGIYINGNTGYVIFTYKGTTKTFSGYSTFPSHTKITIKNGTVTIGNESMSYSLSSFTTSHNIVIFGTHYNGSMIPSLAKIGATYYSDGTSELNLIPVRKDGVGYMYDKNSGQLIGNNASSGAFIIGPDKIGGGKSLVINMLCGFSVERRAA